MSSDNPNKKSADTWSPLAIARIMELRGSGPYAWDSREKRCAMLVQHWVFLVSCWAYPNRSLVKAAQTVQKHALHLASTFGSLRRLIAALMTVQRCVAAGCRMNRRKQAPNTYQLLLDDTSLTTALA
jgi:hypothetical protein